MQRGCVLQEDDVWKYWGYCGEIESLDLMHFPDTGRFKGICFITFKTVSPQGPSFWDF